MANEDDAARVRRCLAGDTRAFGDLIEAHQHALFNLALRMTGNREDARDVTQTVFLKAFDRLHQFDPERKFFSWIYRIMINESLNLIGQRRPHEPLHEGMVSSQRTPEELAERRESDAQVQEALLQLPEDYRQTIVLRHFLQMSYREMGEALGIPEKTVKSRLYTARQLLGECLRRRGAHQA